LRAVVVEGRRRDFLGGGDPSSASVLFAMVLIQKPEDERKMECLSWKWEVESGWEGKQESG
jgi:hypothetical protein